MKYSVIILLFLGVLYSTATAQFDLSTAAGDEDRAEYEKYVEDNAPSEEAFVAIQRIAYFPIKHREWKDAADIFRKYQSKFPSMQHRFETIIAMLEAPSEDLKLSNLGFGVNTAKDEYSPTPSADGKKLYFTRSNGTNEGETNDDVMVSEYREGMWQPANFVGSNIDTKDAESVNGISADGQRMMLFGNYDGSLGMGDIFYSVKNSEGQWGEVQHFPPPINSEHFEADANYTSDGKAIIFTSDRPGCIGEYHAKGESFHGDKWGNTDIFVSIKQDDGSWGAPINLGPTVNTPYSERKPFLHPDGKTLYFCSDGHAGFGMMDIYKTTRLKEDSWTEWSEPVNLGKEINNGADNFGYKVSTDGSIAYLSLDNRKEGYGMGDIYTMTLSKSAKPSAVATISGVVTDENGVPLDASIKWDNLETGKNIGELSSDPKSGNYFITLPLDKNYGYYAEKPGYYPVSKNVDLRGTTAATSRTENIVLVSIKAMKEKAVAVRLNNIFFDFDKAALKPESYPELNRLAEVLKKNPDVKVEVGGHTDNKGSHQYNLDLSKKRTQAVVAYLVSQGCQERMLSSKGYAEMVPVASNESEDGRAQNRRVEVKFLK